MGVISTISLGIGRRKQNVALVHVVVDDTFLSRNLTNSHHKLPAKTCKGTWN
ncbi:hypothetical protein PM082_019187 [Marasmius tenuissimus]|nr:hypothetical protein PM082_019187 [Marasmius tenuissimus]